MKRQKPARLVVLDDGRWNPLIAEAARRLEAQSETPHPWLRELTRMKLREAHERLLESSFTRAVRA